MTLPIVAKLHRALERTFPEQRLFLRSDTETRFIRLSPLTQFVGLTGSETQVREIASAYRVHRRKVVEKGADAGDYLVDHASITYLMGPDGKFRTLFPHNTAGSVMAERIAKYLE